MDNGNFRKKADHFFNEDIVLYIPDFIAKINSLVMPHKAGVSLPDPEYYILREKNWFSDNGYILEYVISGKGYIEYGGTVYPVHPGDFYLINRGVYCCYYSDPDDPYRKIWINGVGRLFNALIYAYNINQPILILPCPNSYDCFLRIHEILKKCNKTNIHQYNAELAMEITKLFVEVDQAHQSVVPQSYGNLVNFQDIVRFIQDNITNWNLSVDYVAHSFFISRMTLYRLFKKNMDISPQDYIEQAKIEYAKNTFLISDSTVAKVANLLHYKNTRCFTLAFKRVEGISPTEWKRKQNLDGKSEH